LLERKQELDRERVKAQKKKKKAKGDSSSNTMTSDPCRCDDGPLLSVCRAEAARRRQHLCDVCSRKGARSFPVKSI